MMGPVLVITCLHICEECFVKIATSIVSRPRRRSFSTSSQNQVGLDLASFNLFLLAGGAIIRRLAKRG